MTQTPTHAYTGKQIVQVAMDMEKLGLTFYRALASACDNHKVSQVCAALAEAEARHYNVFKGLLATVYTPGVDVPMTEEQKAEADRLIKSAVLPDPAEVQRVGIGGSVKEAISMAIKMERDSIRFYQQMLRLIPSGSAAVERIILEEQTHLRDLQALGM